MAGELEDGEHGDGEHGDGEHGDSEHGDDGYGEHGVLAVIEMVMVVKPEKYQYCFFGVILSLVSTISNEILNLLELSSAISGQQHRHAAHSLGQVYWLSLDKQSFLLITVRFGRGQKVKIKLFLNAKIL